MGDKTKIEWSDATWNPTTGCDKVSPGCDHCYALDTAARMKNIGVPEYQRDGRPETSGPGFGVTEHPHRLDQPLRWTKPRRVFVNSMSDLFHPQVSDQFIADVFAVMALADRHTFQVLTKRPKRMRGLLCSNDFQALFAASFMRLRPSPTVNHIEWPLPNVWLGVTVEDQASANTRVPLLLLTPAAIRFLSCEPLLGEVDLEGIVLPEPRSTATGHDKYDPTTEPFPGVYNALTDQWWPAVGNADREWEGRQQNRFGATIDWVIVGGESGKDARPMHPTWARTLRDQCLNNGTAYLFKQWGEWAPSMGHPMGTTIGESTGQRSRSPRSRRGGYLDRSGYWRDSNELAHFRVPGDWVDMRRYGKRTTGRALDGRTWDQYPGADTATAQEQP